MKLVVKGRHVVGVFAICILKTPRVKVAGETKRKPNLSQVLKPLVNVSSSVSQGGLCV